jgi:hypothetical protein
MPREGTKSGRYCLKGSVRRKPERGAQLLDMGCDEKHLTGLRESGTCRRRAKVRLLIAQTIERAKGKPFLSWLIAGVGEALGCSSLLAWQSIKREEVKDDVLVRVLSQISHTGLGELTVREVKTLVRAGWYVLPTSKQHMDSLPSDNGMLSDKLVKKLLRA